MNDAVAQLSKIPLNNVENYYSGKITTANRVFQYSISFESKTTSEGCVDRLIRFYQRIDEAIEIAYRHIPDNQEHWWLYFETFITDDNPWFDDSDLLNVFGHSNRADISINKFYDKMELHSVAIWSACTDEEQAVFEFAVGPPTLNDQWMAVSLNTRTFGVLGVSWES